MSKRAFDSTANTIERSPIALAPAEATEQQHAATDHADVIRAARAYIEVNCTRTVTLAELARITGFSQFHLCRIFRDATGVPPYAYLIRTRLRRARRLIAAGEPLSTVAYATGFSDQSHLTRHFKRAFGMTPGQYARAALELAPLVRRLAS